MNICIVGKYPPIQGGVSKETYWLASGLAQRGHQVIVVSNAPEVEKRYRIFLDKDDEKFLEPAFPESGGRVTLKTVDVFSHARMTHIPLSKPFLSQLAGLAAESVRSQACDVLFGYYLEPYGVAAHLASNWTGRPYIVKHAGSDIDRLMNVPALGESYRQVFLRATSILTTPGLLHRFVRLGASPEALKPDVGFELPSQFTRNAAVLDVAAQLDRARDWLDYVPDALRHKRDGYNTTLPTIGVYGKVGDTKGSFDLIAALARLKSQGLRFNFLCMVNGLGFPRFAQAVIDAGLSQCTTILPFLPHWKVPEFIRACTAVCFLERAFPIAIHGPSVPREVLSCGGCLIVSGEIVGKQRRFLDFRPEENSIVVEDPRNTDELAAALRGVIESPDKAHRIGAAAETAFVTRRSNDGWIVAFEALCAAIGCKSVTGSSHPTDIPAVDRPIMTLASLLPWTSRLQPSYPNVIPALHQPGVTRDEALRFCERALERLTEMNGSHSGLRSIVRFEHAVLIAIKMAQSGGPAFRHGDTIGDNLCTPQTIFMRRPEANRHAVFQPFEYDIEECQRLFETDSADLGDIRPDPCDVLIAPRPNGSVIYSRVSVGTRVLLEACDGRRTVRDVIKEIAGEKATDTTVAAVCTALAKLHQSGLVIFY